MHVIWEESQVSAEQVRSALAKSHSLTDSTIRTVLRRLVAKGYVTHRSEGRTYIYSPVVASENVAADAVRSIIDRFCNGSVESLLVGMIDREVVSPEKLQELVARIAESEKNQGGDAETPSKNKPAKKITWSYRTSIALLCGKPVLQSSRSVRRRLAGFESTASQRLGRVSSSILLRSFRHAIDAFVRSLQSKVGDTLHRIGARSGFDIPLGNRGESKCKTCIY